ncbi:MAG: transcriptional regulator [Thalassobius sp.]|nr:transcriptional regulator [Thalassovita sp.]
MRRRNTNIQTAILNHLKKTKKALSHEMIESEMKGSVNRATIYRALNRFHEDGLVHKVQADDGKQYFTINTDCEDDHFHFRCTNCGKVECLEQEIKIELPEGYTCANINAIVSGLCAGCIDKLRKE